VIEGAQQVDWHVLGWAGIVFVCLMILLLEYVPSDAGRHDDDDDPPLSFPPF
jgi:hypothetical protein